MTTLGRCWATAQPASNAKATMVSFQNFIQEPPETGSGASAGSHPNPVQADATTGFASGCGQFTLCAQQVKRHRQHPLYGTNHRLASPREALKNIQSEN
jgi:hypothetical protein